MRGHIRKRGNNYTIILNLGRDPATGKRKQQWVSGGRTKREAEKRLSELLYSMDTGGFVKPTKLSVANFLEQWLEDNKHNLSPRSYERYEGIIRNHIIPGLGNISLTRLKPEHLQNHYKAELDRGLSARTVKWGLLSRNVADAVSPPKVHNPDIQIWDEDEIKRFLESAKGSPYYDLFYVALFTGMRRSELLALRWQDVDLILSQIYVNRSMHHLKDGSYIFTEPKSDKSRRTIALPPSATLRLSEYREKLEQQYAMLGTQLTDDCLVFCHLDGRPLRPNTVTRAWTNLAAHAGLKVIRLHDARHTHASIMLKQGIHPKIVQERLGHSSIQITLDIYSHLAPGLQDAAAKRFDEGLFPQQEMEVARHAVATLG
jgi:integrase